MITLTQYYGMITLIASIPSAKTFKYSSNVHIWFSHMFIYSIMYIVYHSVQCVSSCACVIMLRLNAMWSWWYTHIFLKRVCHDQGINRGIYTLQVNTRTHTTPCPQAHALTQIHKKEIPRQPNISPWFFIIGSWIVNREWKTNCTYDSL